MSIAARNAQAANDWAAKKRAQIDRARRRREERLRASEQSQGGGDEASHTRGDNGSNARYNDRVVAADGGGDFGAEPSGSDRRRWEVSAPNDTSENHHQGGAYFDDPGLAVRDRHDRHADRQWDRPGHGSDQRGRASETYYGDAVAPMTNTVASATRDLVDTVVQMSDSDAKRALIQLVMGDCCGAFAARVRDTLDQHTSRYTITPPAAAQFSGTAAGTGGGSDVGRGYDGDQRHRGNAGQSGADPLPTISPKDNRKGASRVDRYAADPDRPAWNDGGVDDQGERGGERHDGRSRHNDGHGRKSRATPNRPAWNNDFADAGDDRGSVPEYAAARSTEVPPVTVFDEDEHNRRTTGRRGRDRHRGRGVEAASSDRPPAAAQSSSRRRRRRASSASSGGPEGGEDLSRARGRSGNGSRRRKPSWDTEQDTGRDGQYAGDGGSGDRWNDHRGSTGEGRGAAAEHDRPIAPAASGNRPAPQPEAPLPFVDAPIQTSPCSVCGRKFASDRLQRHENICRKSKAKRRPKFDITERRVGGEAIQMMSDDPIPAKKKKKANWRKQHEQFINVVRSAKQYSAAVARGEDPPPPPPSAPEDDDRVKCPHCSRSFNEAAADRHIPKCKNIKARPARLVRKSGRY